jgi:glycosyltransferase involved in cell wall biosynthesis
LKVLHLHAGTLYGGVETFLTTLVREGALCPEMEHVFGVCFETRLTKDLRELDTPVTMLGEARFSNPLSVLQTRKALGQLVRETKPDVALCHMAKPYWLFQNQLRKAGVPVIYYMHGPIHTLHLFDKLIRKGPAPDLLIGVSKHTMEQGREVLFPKAQTGVINYPMPWPFERYEGESGDRASLRREFETKDDDIVIVQAARMNEWKGQKNLLAALALMKDTPGWVHWMLGGAQSEEEKAYFASLQEMAKADGIADRVRFIGQRSDVPRFLAASDIYCQANNESEGFSLSFTEAFSAGLPIITTDIGSASEVVSPDTGILTPLHDDKALAEALKALVTDSARRTAMGQAAKQRVKMLCDTGQQIRRVHSELSRVARPATKV